MDNIENKENKESIDTAFERKITYNDDGTVTMSKGRFFYISEKIDRLKGKLVSARKSILRGVLIATAAGAITASAFTAHFKNKHHEEFMHAEETIQNFDYESLMDGYDLRQMGMEPASRLANPNNTDSLRVMEYQEIMMNRLRILVAQYYNIDPREYTSICFWPEYNRKKKSYGGSITTPVDTIRIDEDTPAEIVRIFNFAVGVREQIYGDNDRFDKVKDEWDIRFDEMMDDLAQIREKVAEETGKSFQ